MNSSTSNSTLSGNIVHPGRQFFENVNSPPKTGAEFLDWICSENAEHPAFSAQEKAYVFNYFVKQLMTHDPRYSDESSQVSWSGQVETRFPCGLGPRGDLLICTEGESHGFVISKFRANEKAHLSPKDIKGFEEMCANHLTDCNSTKNYLVSTVRKFTHVIGEWIDLILRDDILHPITNYALAMAFGEIDRAERIDLALLMKQYRSKQAADSSDESEEESDDESPVKLQKKEKGKEKKDQKPKRPTAATKSCKGQSSSSKKKHPTVASKSCRKSSSSKKKSGKTVTKVKKDQKKGKNLYRHVPGTERVGWRTVLLREIYQIHQNDGKINTYFLTSGKRGRELYLQVTTRRDQEWKKLVRELRTRILAVLRQIEKDGGVVKKENKCWVFTKPIPNKEHFGDLPWAKKWEHIQNFVTIFGRLPEQKDAVNPILTDLWLARQEIDYAMDGKSSLQDHSDEDEEEQECFDPDHFLQQACNYINDKDLLTKASTKPILLPVAV